MPTGNVYDRDTNTPEGQAVSRAAMYDGNPQAQMRNALKAQGFNPNRRNPFMAQLMQAAQGLGLSSEMANAGLSPADAIAQGGAPMITQNFMNDAIKNGSVFSTLAKNSGGLQGLMPQLTAYENNRENLGPDQQNPFMELLADRFANPKGASEAIGSLSAPLMGRQLGQAYVGQVGDSLSNAFDTMANDPNTFGPNQKDFWDYIFGNRVNGPAMPPARP